MEQTRARFCFILASLLHFNVTLKKGAPGDVVIFDPKKKVKIDRESFKSWGRNTPFHGWELKGEINYTIVNGSVVYSS